MFGGSSIRAADRSTGLSCPWNFDQAGNLLNALSVRTRLRPNLPFRQRHPIAKPLVDRSQLDVA